MVISSFFAWFPSFENRCRFLRYLSRFKEVLEIRIDGYKVNVSHRGMGTASEWFSVAKALGASDGRGGNFEHHEGPRGERLLIPKPDDLTLTLQDALWKYGNHLKDCHWLEYEPCPRCHGTGSAGGHFPVCPECKGGRFLEPKRMRKCDCGFEAVRDQCPYPRPFDELTDVQQLSLDSLLPKEEK